MTKAPFTAPAIHVLKHLAGIEPLRVDAAAYSRHCQALNVRGLCRRTPRGWRITPSGQAYLKANSNG